MKRALFALPFVAACMAAEPAPIVLGGPEIARVTSSKPKENVSGKGEFERAWTQPIGNPRR